MTRRASISGSPQLRALEVLSVFAESRMARFVTMDRDQQEAAVGRSAVSGCSDHTIAQATGLSVELVRRIIGDRK